MRTRSMLLTAASALIVMAGCGGDDGGSGSVSDLADATAAPSSSGGGSTDTIIDAGDIPDVVPEDCQQLYVAFANSFAAVGTADEQGLASTGEAFQRMKEFLPDELDADLDVVSEAFNQLAAILAEYDYDFAAMMADPSAQDALAGFNDDAYNDAFERLDEYFQSQCPS